MIGGIVTRRLAGAAVALLATAAITAASRTSLTAHASSDAMLRLSWTARPERIEECRTVGAEELAEVPAHMRQPVVCEGVTAGYRVDVLRDGRLLASDALRGGGLRNDRQLYHHRELPVPSGIATYTVRVVRTSPAPDAARTQAQADDDGRRRRRGEEIPPSLLLEETVTLEPREVMLVLYDRTTRRLRAVRKASR